MERLGVREQQVSNSLAVVSLMIKLRRFFLIHSFSLSRLKLTKMSVDFVVSVLKSHKSRFRCGSAALAEPNNPMASQQDTKGHFWGLRKVAPPSLKGQQQTATVELKKLKNVPLSGVNSTMQQRRPLMKYPATGDKNNPSNKPTKRLNNKKLRVDSMDSALGQVRAKMLLLTAHNFVYKD